MKALCVKVVMRFTKTINKIRSNMAGHKLFSIDETTDVYGRYITNVIIGTLELDKPGKIYLLNLEVLEKTNYSTTKMSWINQCFFFGLMVSLYSMIM